MRTHILVALIDIANKLDRLGLNKISNEFENNSDDESRPTETFTWKKHEGIKEWTTYYKNFKALIYGRRDRFDAKVFEGHDENHDFNTQYKEFASITKEETPTGKGLDLAKKWAEDTIRIQGAPSRTCHNCKKSYKGKFEGWYKQFCSKFCEKRFSQKHKKVSFLDYKLTSLKLIKLADSLDLYDEFNVANKIDTILHKYTQDIYSSISFMKLKKN